MSDGAVEVELEKKRRVDEAQCEYGKNRNNDNNVKKHKKDDDSLEAVTILQDLKENLNYLIYRNIIRQVFLNLDPVSVRRARLACREWDELVKREIWGSEEGKRVMESRLDRQWREARPGKKEIVFHADRVVNLACDETHIAVQLVVYEDGDFGVEKRWMDEVDTEEEVTDGDEEQTDGEEEQSGGEEEQANGEEEQANGEGELTDSHEEQTAGEEEQTDREGENITVISLYSTADLSSIYTCLVDCHKIDNGFISLGRKCVAFLSDEQIGTVLRVWSTDGWW